MIKLNKNQHFISIMLCDAVGEYPLPEFDYATVSECYNWFRTQEIIRIEHQTEDYEIIDPILQKILDSQLKEFSQDNLIIASWDKQTSSNYVALTIWKTDKEPFEKTILRYLLDFKEYILNKWHERGADDDYFDYLPSLSDMLLQLCLALDELGLWEDFLKELTSFEPEVQEDSLYRIK